MARYFSAEAKNIAETRSTQAKETGVGSEETITVFEPDLDNFKKREKKKHFLPSKVEELNKSRWNISGGEQKLKQQNSGQDGKKGKAKKGFREDPFPGDAPVPRSKMKHYIRKNDADLSGMKTNFHRSVQQKQEGRIHSAVKQAARSELLRHEKTGFLETSENASTSHIKQHDMVENVDISSAAKHFELNMDKFGPYKVNYTRNGRFLLMGGKKGHIAALDWQTKKLMCEMNVMETCHAIKWLHNETMFAAAQKKWTYIYDNKGIELHCLKLLDKTLQLEFLPYHFLLVASNARSFLTYIDVSIGKKVAALKTKMGRLNIMTQNPRNAIIHLGHPGGTVSLWSPNMDKPLVKMLCHPTCTNAIAVDHTGNYMATAGTEAMLKIWDLRMYKALKSCRTRVGARRLTFSQQGLLAASLGNIVKVYDDAQQSGDRLNTYLYHKVTSTIDSLQFCPYEDVLGIGHEDGFCSMLVPGAGEANFDAFEANPFQTKKQRQEAEVKMLLDKIHPDMISLDTSMLGKVEETTIEQEMAAKVQSVEKKIDKIKFTPRHKKKGRSTAQKMLRRKSNVILERKLKKVKELNLDDDDTSSKARRKATFGVLDRFQKK